VIIKLANRQLPFAIDKIVLVDSAGIKPAGSKKKSFRQRIFKLGKWFLSLKPIAKLFPTALEKLRVKFGSADYAAASPMMRQCLVKAVNEDLSHLLPGIKAPTLLVWGDRDTATPISDANGTKEASAKAMGVPVENIERSIKTMRKINNMFSCKSELFHGIAHVFLKIAGMERKFGDMFLHKKDDPACADWNDILYQIRRTD
jgi:pimeloyl-ACP methyl ester carboxylesterase